MTLIFKVSLTPVKWLPRTPDNNEVIKIVIWRVAFVKSDDAGVDGYVWSVLKSYRHNVY